MPICLDPSGTTFVYSLYLETLSVTERGRPLHSRQAFFRWTLKGLEDRSSSFPLGTEPDWNGFCSFVLVCFKPPEERHLCIRLALTGTSPVSDLGVCFLDLADLSAEERFKVDFLELRDAKLQAVAVAKLHSACQQRWSTEQLPLVPTKQAFFLDYTMDAQARRLYEHIAAAAGMGTATSPAFSGAGRSAPRDPELAEEKRSSGTPSRTSKEAFRSGEMRTELEPDAQSGLLGDLWGFLTLAGCAPERCAPKRCGCQWEDGAILPMQRPEAPRPGACSEEPINFQAQPPTAGHAAAASARWPKRMAP
ncbi:unnamed protein product [Durusdinium trenchii]|uniref:Uncharacterized protein n=1 Tax=Durusdinium trenchii TaxID=1381693 RepID=A0ABP0K8H6_9DINO